MEKLKIKISNEEECEKIYNKAIELKYKFYDNVKPPLNVDVIFLDEDGDLTVSTGNPKDYVPKFLLEEFLEDVASYPEITVEKFMKK